MSAVAVPVPSAKFTVIVRSLAALRVTSNDSVAVSPSSLSATIGEEIDSVGAPSSSRMVTVAEVTVTDGSATAPLTVTVRSRLSSASFTGVSVNIPCALTVLVGIVIVKVTYRSEARSRH